MGGWAIDLGAGLGYVASNPPSYIGVRYMVCGVDGCQIRR
ncbi:unnamed protein product [Calypogeia fissa]